MSLCLFFKTSLHQLVVLDLEKIVWKGKPTIFAFYDGVVGGSFLTVVSIALLILFPHTPLFWLSILGFASAMLMVAFVFIKAEASTYVITNKGVRREYRFLTIETCEIPFEKITNITVFQDVVGKVLKFGTIRVDSAAGEFFGGVVFRGVVKPEEIKAKIAKMREKRVGK